MNNQVRIGIVFVLFVFILSLGVSNESIFINISRKPDFKIPDEFKCMVKTIPPEQTVLFFSRVDGSLDWGKYSMNGLYFKTQFYLAPRIIDARSNGKIDFQEYGWYIFRSTDGDQVNEVMQANALEKVETCGENTILKKLSFH